METDSLLDLYRNFYFSSFLPAYADLTGYTLKKHDTVLFSIDSAHSHLMQYLSPDLDLDAREQNLRKAQGHIERATLDCYKLLWLFVEEDLTSLMGDAEKRVLCVNMVESDLVSKYHEALAKILESRHCELQNVGINLIDTIEKYRAAIEVTKEIIENVDRRAIELYEKKKKRQKWIDIGIGIIIGIIGSTLSAPIITFLFQ